MKNKRDKSMIIDHPFWDRIKAKKGTTDPRTGLEIKEFIIPNKKYFNFIKKLLNF